MSFYAPRYSLNWLLNTDSWRFIILIVAPLYLTISVSAQIQIEATESNTAVPPAETKTASDLYEYRSLFQQARAYCEGGEYEKAKSIIQQAITLNPEVPQGYNLLGICQTKLKDYTAAIESFQKMVEVDPKSAAITDYNIGEIYFLQGNYTRARNYFEKFLTSTPPADQVSLTEYKIYLCHLKNNYPLQAGAYLETLKPDPANPVYYFAKAAYFFNSNNHTAAFEELKSAERIYSPRARSNYIESFYTLGWVDKYNTPDEANLIQLQTQESQATLTAFSEPSSLDRENSAKSKSPVNPQKIQLAPANNSSGLEDLLPSLDGTSQDTNPEESN